MLVVAVSRLCLGCPGHNNHPQGDGRAERVIGTLTRRLRRLITDEDGGSEWARLLPWVVAAYNGTEHRATGETPHFLLFGRELRLPTTATSLGAVTTSTRPVSPHAADMRKAIRRVRQRLKAGRRADEATRQAGRRPGRMGVGSRVWLYSPRGPRASKLRAKWVGPLRVVHVPSAQTRQLETRPGADPVTVNVGRLKPFREWEEGPAVEPELTEGLGQSSEAEERLAVAAADSPSYRVAAP